MRHFGIVRVLGLGLVLAGSSAATPAAAQFFGFPWEVSPREVYRIAYEHGFTLIAAPARNGGVYIADATDERGRQMRLIVDAQSGEIMQRFRFGPPRPPGSIARATPDAPRVARATPDADQPAVIPGYGAAPAVVEPRARVKPRVARPRPAAREATRAPAKVVDPVSPAPVAPVVPAAPAPTVAEPVRPPSEPAKAAPVTAEAPQKPVAPAPAPVKPVAQKPVAPKDQDIPVAPLD